MTSSRREGEAGALRIFQVLNPVQSRGILPAPEGSEDPAPEGDPAAHPSHSQRTDKLPWLPLTKVYQQRRSTLHWTRALEPTSSN